MEEKIITWNVPNMVTICLMAFLGFAMLGVITKLVVKAKADA